MSPYVVILILGEDEYLFWRGDGWSTLDEAKKYETYGKAFVAVYEECPEPSQGTKITAVPTWFFAS